MKILCKKELVMCEYCNSCVIFIVISMINEKPFHSLPPLAGEFVKFT